MLCRFVAAPLAIIIAGATFGANAAGEYAVCVQKEFNALGYQVGSADGIIGEKTLKAAAEFIADNDAVTVPDELSELTAKEWCSWVAAMRPELIEIALSTAAEMLSSPTIHVYRQSPRIISKRLSDQSKDTIANEIQILDSEVGVLDVSKNGRDHAILFVFPKSLEVGTNIRTEHQFYRPNLGVLEPYVFEYVVESNTDVDPLLILNASTADGAGGSITYRGYVDGALVSEMELQIR